ncbi:MAG: hypothetical protein IKQ33_01695 [Clostridia bacterium]|nr:hypothetical protein [Clostridia bacterium]
MKLCAIEPKELEEKILTRFAENQNDELLEDLSDYVINSQKEIVRLNDIINELEKYKHAYESIIKSLKGNINFLKRNELSKERIEEDTRIIRDLRFYYKNTEGDKE